MSKPNKEISKERVKRLRDDTDHSRGQLATNLTPQNGIQVTVKMIEHAERDGTISNELCESYSKYFAVSKEYILGYPEEIKHPTNLKAKPPLCIGREDLLAKLNELFVKETAKLPNVPITGIGGIGKSTAVLWFLHDEQVAK